LIERENSRLRMEASSLEHRIGELETKVDGKDWGEMSHGLRVRVAEIETEIAHAKKAARRASQTHIESTWIMEDPKAAKMKGRIRDLQDKQKQLQEKINFVQHHNKSKREISSQSRVTGPLDKMKTFEHSNQFIEVPDQNFEGRNTIPVNKFPPSASKRLSLRNTTPIKGSEHNINANGGGLAYSTPGKPVGFSRGPDGGNS
jgi:hypothetical protein